MTLSYSVIPRPEWDAKEIDRAIHEAILSACEKQERAVIARQISEDARIRRILISRRAAESLAKSKPIQPVPENEELNFWLSFTKAIQSGKINPTDGGYWIAEKYNRGIRCNFENWEDALEYAALRIEALRPKAERGGA